MKYQSLKHKDKVYTYIGDNEKGEAKLQSEKGNIRYVSKSDLKLFYKLIKAKGETK